ncbi:endonuclease domain-containing protein [Streptomyces sp. NBC_01527]|uniref:endonuclease domain-containing protein n=1 Tax=Streptomyces sp. NBC_01527 TaxID=2903894 RepID=UPI00386CE056
MYGLTLDQVRLVRDVRECMICASTVSGFESGIFAVDHCHDSGIVRGVLCQPCNFLLGNARDDVDILWNAIKYLQKDHSVEPWNQGPSRAAIMSEREERRLAARLERTEKDLKLAERRVRELEGTLAEVSEDTAMTARRRAKDADAVESFINELISPTPRTGSRIPVNAIRTAWTEWSGGTSCPVQSLHEALYKLGGFLRRTSTGRYWEGIALRPSSEESAEGSRGTSIPSPRSDL